VVADLLDPDIGPKLVDYTPAQDNKGFKMPVINLSAAQERALTLELRETMGRVREQLDSQLDSSTK
jgi:hypothetical protein